MQFTPLQKRLFPLLKDYARKERTPGKSGEEGPFGLLFLLCDLAMVAGEKKERKRKRKRDRDRERGRKRGGGRGERERKEKPGERESSASQVAVAAISEKKKEDAVYLPLPFFVSSRIMQGRKVKERKQDRKEETKQKKTGNSSFSSPFCVQQFGKRIKRGRARLPFTSILPLKD